jgi:hypothetical protein
MATAKPAVRPPDQPRVYYPLAGVLSYLVPGLGQITQGRVGKGVLFLVCIYTLFFYGVYLGSGEVTREGHTYRTSGVVYLPDVTEPSTPSNPLQRLGSNLYNRPQFAGQFWVGIVAWPAIVHYLRHDHVKYKEVDTKYNNADRDPETGAPTERDRAARLLEEAGEKERELDHPLLGGFQREPAAASLNVIHNAGDKRLELAWVFTVIAGVLNILVIYDAVAGPAHALAASQEKKG